jgi:putative zinc finger protein
MNCNHCEERMSDYLENPLGMADRAAVELHLRSCAACSELMSWMTEVLVWGKGFPVYRAPAWLASRAIAIAANTPRVVRESWVDMIASIGKWIIEPRTAMAFFTATLVLSWMGSLAGISPDWANVVRNPAAIYYGAQGAANRAYDEAVRKVYRSPLVSEIQTRLEQLREIS